VAIDVTEALPLESMTLNPPSKVSTVHRSMIRADEAAF